MTYDAKSYELAEHFMQDVHCRDEDRKAKTISLAEDIQQAVEEWMQHEADKAGRKEQQRSWS